MPNLIDGSVMLLEREIGQIPYAPNQQRKLDLKLQPNLIKHLLLHFQGKISCTELSEPEICHNTGPFDIIRQIQVRASNGVILKAITAQALNLLNSYEFASRAFFAGFVPDMSGGIDKEFAFDLLIPFENHTGFLPERTILNTNEFSEIGLYLDWGSNLDLCVGAGQAPVYTIDELNCHVVALERVPLDMSDELLTRQRMVDTMQVKPAVSEGIVTFDLPENTLLKTLLFYVEKKARYVEAPI